MVSFTLLLALVTAAAAKDIQPFGFKAHHLNQTNLLTLGLSSRTLDARQAATCSTFQDLCDGEFCIPSTATCCGNNNGAYCEIGKRCIKQGCCPIGQTCVGKPKCDSDEELCGTFCMPKGSVCCEEEGGSYCDEGAKCTANGCNGGKSSGDDGRGGGVIGDTPRLGGDGSSGDGGSSGGGSSGGGSSGGSGGDGPKCFDFQKPCGSRCMPDSGVCCDGKYYCLAGSECKDDGTCGLEGGWPGDDDFTATRTSASTSTSSIALSGLPTGPRSGDDTLSNDDSDDTSSNSNSNNGNDDGPSSGGGGSSSSDEEGEDGAGVVHGPSFAAAAVAVAALLM